MSIFSHQQLKKESNTLVKHQFQRCNRESRAFRCHFPFTIQTKFHYEIGYQHKKVQPVNRLDLRYQTKLLHLLPPNRRKCLIPILVTLLSFFMKSKPMLAWTKEAKQTNTTLSLHNFEVSLTSICFVYFYYIYSLFTRNDEVISRWCIHRTTKYHLPNTISYNQIGCISANIVGNRNDS